MLIPDICVQFQFLYHIQPLITDVSINALLPFLNTAILNSERLTCIGIIGSVLTFYIKLI